jgi:hypothetical protein
LFDRLIRYLPVLDYIKKYKPLRILEVGSSSRGIGEFYDGEFTGVDMDFPEKPVSNMKAVVGSVENLPFNDGEFDLVFSIDMFEHIPEGIRSGALQEMMRVGLGEEVNQKSNIKNQNDKLKFKNFEKTEKKIVIVGFPCGEGAEKLSKKMFAWFRERNSGTVKWMEEHVENGLPSSLVIPAQAGIQGISGFDSRFRGNDSVEVFNNENLLVCEWLLKLEENGRFLKIERYLLRWFDPEIKFILRRLSFGKCYRKFYLISSII